MPKVLHLEDILVPDDLATRLSRKYIEWELLRQVKVDEWTELQKYLFATDTTKTSNATLPWSNKTTIPKLCQIRDNLYANYMATLFPKRKFMEWTGDSEVDDNYDKKSAIESYMVWATDRPEFYKEVGKLVLDYIDYGNLFAMPDWQDNRKLTDSMEQIGYVGPVIRRISPTDIVFDPTANDFPSAPKIIRSFMSLGEAQEIIINNSSTEEERQEAQELVDYLSRIRREVQQYNGNVKVKDDLYASAGFTSFQHYLSGDYVEVLTFYGDVYDSHTDELKRNKVIKIIDRHKIICEKDNPSYFDHPPIYHVGWRVRPDNLWAMGPLDNLVGMQYRIDHLENMKADVFDLIAYPPIKIKGDPEAFEWGPFEKIYLGDDADVELMSPNVQALQADTQIAILEQKMEEMAGSPKQAMGFRTPGEKTAFEVQSLENAASRIFQSKSAQLERDGLEPTLNGMLELARRKVNNVTIRVFDEEEKINTFIQLSSEDLVGQGRIRPVAARHFAEKAQTIQNLTQLMNSVLATDPEIMAHFSSTKMARLLEDLLDLDRYNIVEPFVRITEQAEGQRIAAINQENVETELQTPSGLQPDDFDPDLIEQEEVEAIDE